MDVVEAITSRHSVRAFLPRPVPRETVERIIEVAARAPSSGNIQPWRVHVVAGETKERLTQAIMVAREVEAAGGVTEDRRGPSTTAARGPVRRDRHQFGGRGAAEAPARHRRGQGQGDH